MVGKSNPISADVNHVSISDAVQWTVDGLSYGSPGFNFMKLEADVEVGCVFCFTHFTLHVSLTL